MLVLPDVLAVIDTPSDLQDSGQAATSDAAPVVQMSDSDLTAERGERLQAEVAELNVQKSPEAARPSIGGKKVWQSSSESAIDEPSQTSGNDVQSEGTSDHP